jgi:hypothetical protein
MTIDLKRRQAKFQGMEVESLAEHENVCGEEGRNEKAGL